LVVLQSITGAMRGYRVNVLELSLLVVLGVRTMLLKTPKTRMKEVALIPNQLFNYL